MSIRDLRGVIFDVDGTLGNTLEVCFAGFDAAFATAGLSFTREEILANFGPTEEGIIRKMVPAESAEKAIETYQRVYGEAHAEVPDPFEGIVEVLQVLRRRGMRLAVATGKGRHGAEITMEQFGIRELFDVMETGSEEAFVKPELLRRVIKHWGFKPEETVYVGDSAWDVDAAHEVGAMAISVAWDKMADAKELLAREPMALFETPDQFSRWIRENLPIPA